MPKEKSANANQKDNVGKTAGKREKRDNQDNDIVRLIVGGIKYSATKRVLCSKEGMLKMMFGSGMQPSQMVDGRYVIERDGELFGYILRYLNGALENGHLFDDLFHLTEDQREAIVAEADFFLLEEFIQVLEGFSYGKTGEKLKVVKCRWINFKCVTERNGKIDDIEHLTYGPCENQTDWEKQLAKFQDDLWEKHGDGTCATIFFYPFHVECIKINNDLIVIRQPCDGGCPEYSYDDEHFPLDFEPFQVDSKDFQLLEERDVAKLIEYHWRNGRNCFPQIHERR